MGGLTTEDSFFCLKPATLYVENITVDRFLALVHFGHILTGGSISNQCFI